MIQLMGGLSLFLFGMKIGADGLKSGSGDRMKSLLGRMASGKMRGLTLGIFTTFLTQSSSATSVILVSLVNSALLTMKQTIPILLGAGIGTTLTVQLIAFRFFDYALLLVSVGVFLKLTLSGQGWRILADILLGFGLIFYGMKVMSAAMVPLKSHPGLAGLLISIKESPWLALAGATLVTAIVQSSGATIAILLSLALQGGNGFLESAIPLILGANLGTCITAFVGAAGCSRDAKRVALVQVIMKLSGIILVMFMIPWLAQLTVAITGQDPVRQIANTHTIFNVFLALLLLPLQSPISKLIVKIMPVRKEEKPYTPKYLDRSLLASPSIALEQARLEILRQGKLIRRQLDYLEPLFLNYSGILADTICNNDEKIDLLQKRISAYINLILVEKLPDRLTQEAERLFLINSDLESMGDVVVKNITPLAGKLSRKKFTFSENGEKELKSLFKKYKSLFDSFLGALKTADIRSLQNCRNSARRLRKQTETLRMSHLTRLTERRRQSIETSSIHLDLLDNIRHLCSYIKTMCNYYPETEL